MIKVIAKSLIKEECVEAYVTLAKDLAAKTQANDAGMVYYTLNQSVENPRLFAMLECWESQEALQAHMASAHFTSMVPQMGPMVEQGYPIELFVEK